MANQPDRQAVADRNELVRKTQLRPVATTLAKIALELGAQSPNSTGQELNPCGLDRVLDVLFGEETRLITREVHENLLKELNDV